LERKGDNYENQNDCRNNSDCPGDNVDVGQGPPTLFDLPMQGPEDHGGGPAYERHAWIWRNNPNGMFQPFNPKLSCPEN